MIRHLIHATDPYLGFDPHQWPSEVHGWNDHSTMFSELAKDAKVVVEIGSWLGRSAIALAEACPNAEIICIDTWLGAAEMWTNHADKERYEALGLVHGYPSIYYRFLANVVRAGRQSQITPMPMPASIGLRLLGKWSVRPDLIYIDGDHAVESVTEDIQNSLRLNPRVLAGDDLGFWPGVTSAVARLLPNAKSNADGFWWI